MEVSGVSSQTPQAQNQSSLWDADGFGFGDILDAVNPFQHLPIVSEIYRSITGDSIGGFANVVGSTLFGGPIGGGIALANEVVKQDTGKTLTEHAINTVTGGDSSANASRSASQNALVAEKYEKTEQNTTRNRSTTHDWIYGGTHLA